MAKAFPSILVIIATGRLLLCAFACPAESGGASTDESLIELAKTAILDPFRPGECLFGCSVPTGKASAQEPVLSNEEIITIARTAILGGHFDRSRAISIGRTNGMAVVSFPGKPFRRNDPTNGIDHAAIVWVDETSGTLLPNPNLVPLSDERALFVATNAVPIPFDCSKTVRVDRASSLTLVTLPDHDYETAPGRIYRDAFLAKIWIDTETETVVDGVMGAN